MSLHDDLMKLERYPFHMPGHKRNPKFGIAGAEMDITEIEGFDNLHHAEESIAALQQRFMEHYRSKAAFLLVNGSTVGLLCAVFALCEHGDSIIVARNCHKSVFDACAFLELHVQFAEPTFDEEHAFYTRLSQEALDRAFAACPEAKAAVVVSPTYEGYVSEIHAPVPLIVDAAHGAHFGIPPFPAYPQGDIVISSLHKTLPALTQTAVANVYNADLLNKFKRHLDVFQTSSPSYVLMNSADICSRYLQHCEADFDRYHKALQKLHTLPLNYLKLLETDDIGKLVLSCYRARIKTQELARILRDTYNIEPEAVSMNHILLMTSVGDTEEGFRLLERALTEIDAECKASREKSVLFHIPCPEAFCLRYDEEGTPLKLSDAVGKTANEFVYAYPPDIPLLMPGEVITAPTALITQMLINAGVTVISDSGLLPKVLTKTAE